MAPHEFCVHHTPRDLKKLFGFKHRLSQTLNFYTSSNFSAVTIQDTYSMELAFSQWIEQMMKTLKRAWSDLSELFFSLEDVPSRQKNISRHRHPIQPARALNISYDGW
jgi:hypothetical protein